MSWSFVPKNCETHLVVNQTGLGLCSPTIATPFLTFFFHVFVFHDEYIYIYTMYFLYTYIIYMHIYICNVNSRIEQVGHKDSSQWMGNHQVRHLLPVAGLKLSRDPMITRCWHDVLWESNCCCCCRCRCRCRWCCRRPSQYFSSRPWLHPKPSIFTQLRIVFLQVLSYGPFNLEQKRPGAHPAVQWGGTVEAFSLRGSFP